MPSFRLDITPSTATAQERRWRAAYMNGHWQAVSYLPKKLKDAKKLYTDALQNYAPSTPMDGPIFLHVVWEFPRGKSHKHAEYKYTKPDTDNLMKMFKDCMTAAGFWVDDARVAQEIVTKIWSDNPGITVSYSKLENIEELEDGIPF